MSNRRKFIVALGAGAFAAPFRAFAQQPRKLWRVGVLSIGSPPTAGHLVDAFCNGIWPTVHSSTDYAEAGGVIAYGADYAENCRSSCPYLDKIFKGAKPSELPVQQPVKFKLVINLKSAKSMDLTVPPSLLGRADEVIE